MPVVKFICQYCGHMFQKMMYSVDHMDHVRCGKCGDSHLKHIMEEETDVFGYVEKKKDNVK